MIKRKQEIEQNLQMIEQQARVIEQQNKVLFATIHSLHERGMSVREIADLLSMTEEDVRPFLK